jgi:thymidylate synthase ThyX
MKRSLLRARDTRSGGSRRHRRALENDIEQYYSSLSARERKEDARWADLAVRTSLFG